MAPQPRSVTKTQKLGNLMWHKSVVKTDQIWSWSDNISRRSSQRYSTWKWESARTCQRQFKTADFLLGLGLWTPDFFARFAMLQMCTKFYSYSSNYVFIGLHLTTHRWRSRAILPCETITICKFSPKSTLVCWDITLIHLVWVISLCRIHSYLKDE